MEIDILLSTLYGAVSGLAVGIIPGIAPPHLMSIMFMALFFMSPTEVACFYIGILTVSQYVDAIPAIYFGVPGETSAVPASYEGPKLKAQGYGRQAIRLTAIGRVVACAVSVALISIVLPFILSNTWFFSNNTQMVLLGLAVVGIYFSSSSNHWRTVLGMTIGFTLGLVGYNYNFEQRILTFGNPGLIDGIPIICAIMGLYVIPMMLEELKKAFKGTSLKLVEGEEEKSTPILPHLPNMFQSSVLGWITGLVPGMSYVLSSTFTYNWRKKKEIKAGRYQLGNMPSIVAAETGNTAGAVSTLIPLMVFGIPITWSESIVYNIMVMNNVNFGQAKFFYESFDYLVMAFVIANIIGLVACWPLSKHIASILNKINFKALWIAILSISLGVIVYSGSYYSQLDVYLATFAVCLVIGMLIRGRIDPMPVVFAFLMQDSIELSVWYFTQIYF